MKARMLLNDFEPTVICKASKMAQSLENNPNPSINLVIAGHVDHGKSTLIGRLLHDTDSLTEGKMAAVKAMSERRGMPLEYAFLLDALQAERDQGITIDTTQVLFNSKKRSYLIIDAPGHKEFLKNMISGAAQADAGVVVIDVEEGIQEQSRRHCYLLRLLGLKEIIIVVNKMDLIEYSQRKFNRLKKQIVDYLSEIDLDCKAVVPISARDGEGLIDLSEKMPWYTETNFIDTLDQLPEVNSTNDLPTRLPIQDVYKFDERRIIAGRIESGTLKIGDELLFTPSNKRAAIESFEVWNAKDQKTKAIAGESVGIILNEEIFIERGHIASLSTDAPIETNVFRGKVFWIGNKPIVAGDRLKIKIGTAEHISEVQSIENKIDLSSLEAIDVDRLEKNDIGEVVFRTKSTVALDPFEKNHRTGRFVLINEYETVGGGIVSMQGYADQRGLYDVTSRNIMAVSSRVDINARVANNGHKGGIIWLTGLSGAGKSTIAIEAEHQLFLKGYQVNVLDGDNIRFGLSADLGFSPEDRTENIRRIGEVAKLFAEAGILVITAFISPYKQDRDRIRAIAGDIFHEVFIEADLEICENRDPKGLYVKARNGEISDFTGISAPYEEPRNPELIIDTGEQGIGESTTKLLSYIDEKFSI
ncbi:adenylyl-sulfate kinase [Alphaproteobacteria bacterium]|nr:adenylyl-sulfate kinase [Alphaproteobacteria bacterium]